MKKCSSLAIRKIQIKITLRYYNLTPVRMTKINKAGNNKYCRGCGQRGSPLTVLVGMQVGAATLENSVEIPQKIKIRLTYDLAIALLGIYPKETDVVKRRVICTPMFIATMSTISKLWKQPRCPSTDKWIKMWYIYTMEYYAAIKKTCRLQQRGWN